MWEMLADDNTVLGVLRCTGYIHSLPCNRCGVCHGVSLLIDTGCARGIWFAAGRPKLA